MGINTNEDHYNMGSSYFQCLKKKCRRICSIAISAKVLMSAITTILFITGLLLLTLGVVIVVICAKYEMFLGISFFVLPIFVIATAAIIFVTSMLGYYCAKSGKYDFVLAFAALLVTILVFEILITVLGFQLEEDVMSNKVILHNMLETKQSYGNNYYGTMVWDNMQRELQCCGFYSERDWGGGQLPLSCCYPYHGAMSPYECTARDSFYSGCKEKLRWILEDCAFAIGVTSAVVTSLQGIIIIPIAIWIGFKVKNQQETHNKGLLESPMDKASKAALGIVYSQYHSIPGHVDCESDTDNVM